MCFFLGEMVSISARFAHLFYKGESRFFVCAFELNILNLYLFSLNYYVTTVFCGNEHLSVYPSTVGLVTAW